MVNLEKIGQYTVSVIETFCEIVSQRLKISQWLTARKFRPLMHMPPQLYSGRFPSFLKLLNLGKKARIIKI